jgi:putative addiction module component (TIGR02574 family)
MADQQEFFRELAQSLRRFETRVDARFGDIDGRRLNGLDRRMDALGIEMTPLRRDMTMLLTSQFRWTTGVVISGLTAIAAAVLLREALTLPVDERASLAAELLASLDVDIVDDPAEVEAAWATEIESRARRVMAGESQGIPWEDVRARAEASLRKP